MKTFPDVLRPGAISKIMGTQNGATHKCHHGNGLEGCSHTAPAAAMPTTTVANRRLVTRLRILHLVVTRWRRTDPIEWSPWRAHTSRYDATEHRPTVITGFRGQSGASESPSNAASVGRARPHRRCGARTRDGDGKSHALPACSEFGRVREERTSSGTNLPPIDFKIDSPTTIVVLKVGSPKS